MPTQTQTVEVQIVATEGSPNPTRVKDAYVKVRKTKTAPDACNAVLSFWGTCCASLCMTVILCLVGVMNVYFLVVGALNVDKCRVEPKIPIYLIVTGAFGITRGLLSLYYNRSYYKIAKKEAKEETTVKLSMKSTPSILVTIVDIFLTVWFICGAVWVFKTRPDFANSSSAFYCDKLTYISAYVYVIFSLVLLAVLVLLLIVLFYCICCLIICAPEEVEEIKRQADRVEEGEVSSS